jgi:hypothetical protein
MLEFQYDFVFDLTSITTSIHHRMPVAIPSGAVESVRTRSAALQRQRCANVPTVKVVTIFVAVTRVSPLFSIARRRMINRIQAAMDRRHLVSQHEVNESLARAAGHQRQPPIDARSQLQHGGSSVLRLPTGGVCGFIVPYSVFIVKLAQLILGCLFAPAYHTCCFDLWSCGCEFGNDATKDGGSE